MCAEAGFPEKWTDKRLFESYLSERNEVVYAALYERHWSSLRDCAMQVLKEDHSRAEDIAQEIFLVLLKEAEKLEGIRNLESYLGRMAINRALDLLKRDAMIEPIGLNAEVKGADAFAPGASWTGEAKAEFWEDIRSRLTQAQFRKVELRYGHGLGLAECAKKVGIPKETAKSRIYAAISKLKKLPLR